MAYNEGCPGGRVSRAFLWICGPGTGQPGEYAKPNPERPVSGRAGACVCQEVGGVPIAVQDTPVLSAPQNQQCAENSTQAKGDEPPARVLSDIPVLSENGIGNS
jgi:hypothetical protein